jgi:endonuclease III
MKRLLRAFSLAAVLVVASVSLAQTPDPNQEARLLALIREVQTQQAQLAANQAKIEEKLATVSEIVRDARLYSKRAR